MNDLYGMALVCFDCCRSFQRESNAPPIEYPEKLTCPECGGDAHIYSRHFKAPKKNDSVKWKEIAFLHGRGFRFHKIR